MGGKFIPLIGTPYSKLDCWGVVKEFLKLELGIELKNYYEEIPNDRDKAAALIYTNMGDFKKVDDLKYGDILLIQLENVPCHIAVYIGEEKILHSTSKTGCVIERLSKWKKLIVAKYRV